MTAKRAAWTAGVASTALIVGDLAFLFIDRHAGILGSTVGWTIDDVSLAVLSLAFVALGVILAWRRPDNPIATFSGNGQLVNVRVGETIEGKFILRSIGIESAEIGFVGFPNDVKTRVPLG